MSLPRLTFVVLWIVAMWAAPTQGQTPYPGWRHSGELFLITTPDGANLPDKAIVRDFPVLVRLNEDFFDFRQADHQGNDIRFSSSQGTPLAYQVEEWDAVKGFAAIWVRIPEIAGNSRQAIKIHWGKADAEGESNGKAVFNASNGYVGVWHMTDPTRDETGNLSSVDTGTTASRGVSGAARRFQGTKGLFCGDKITTLPTGSSPHSSEAWIRAEGSNARIVAWGNEQAQGKVVLQLASPPHLRTDCYFSDGNVEGKGTIPTSEWVHVAHTYQKGDSRVYVNGVLDGVSKSTGAALAIPRPAKMWIGGWYHNYSFAGDIDEVRLSNVARSADWIKLQYENQKPLQSLVGTFVRPGNEFSVSHRSAKVLEGRQITVTAKADGAQRVFWSLKRDGREAVVAVDRLSYTLDAGRIAGDTGMTLKFHAIFPDGMKVQEIPVTIQEDIPEPVFTLSAPAHWNGRDTVEISPTITNLDAMKGKNAGSLHTTWTMSGIATIKDVTPGTLVLRRAQNSGVMTVTAVIDNGGPKTEQSISIRVQEPDRDAWIERTPGRDEKPEDNQFFARNDRNEGTLHYTGVYNDDADSVMLRITANDQPYKTESRALGADRSYAFAIKLKPGLIRYKLEFLSKKGDQETVRHTASNLVCGDVYLIQGQSNAVATDIGKDDPTFTSEWIRSFGSPSGNPAEARLKLWANAVARERKGGKAQIGYWGLELGRRLVESQKMPICIINGAVGGTRIDQHQRNANTPDDVATIYGRLLWRVREAKLTHGVRGVLWHQGENDQGADGPTGRFGWETYESYFIDLAAAWKQDFPNIQHNYAFQIWPRACSMGIDGSDNHLREVQRQLPSRFSKLSIMSTLGIKPPGGCHFPPAGYAEFARLIAPLVERDHYGKIFSAAITPANLKEASFASDKNDELVLEFDQPMTWNDAVANHLYLDGVKGRVASGTVTGSLVRLKLKSPMTAKQITYLDSRSWNQDNLLMGENGIAALTFCDVPILARRPSR